MIQGKVNTLHNGNDIINVILGMCLPFRALSTAQGYRRESPGELTNVVRKSGFCEIFLFHKYFHPLRALGIVYIFIILKSHFNPQWEG